MKIAIRVEHLRPSPVFKIFATYQVQHLPLAWGTHVSGRLDVLKAQDLGNITAGCSVLVSSFVFLTFVETCNLGLSLGGDVQRSDC